MITVASYLKGIPPANKNQEKPALLKNFIQGVNVYGDKGYVVENSRILNVDVAVIQGWVHTNSKNVPHLNFRKSIHDYQQLKGKRSVIVDSNLFLYSDPKNRKGYLRYSYDGVFPTTGEYCWDNPNPQRWEQVFKNLGLKLKNWQSNGGNNILVCAQRNGGWSMDGQPTFDWVMGAIRSIQKYTDRPIVVRFHPGDKDHKKHKLKLTRLGIKGVSVSSNADIRQDLTNAWALVNYNSSPAVAAAIEGVPVFALDRRRSQAADVANNDLRLLETPEQFDRLPWVQKIAMCHWNHDELKSGACWSHMRKWAIKE